MFPPNTQIDPTTGLPIGQQGPIGYTPPDITSTAPPVGGIVNSIFGGQAPTLSNILSSIIPIGSALTQYLGTQGAFNTAANDISGAETAGAQGVAGATGNANDILSQLYGNTVANTLPYAATGSTAAGLLDTGLQPGGNLNQPQLTGQQLLEQDPGYQFRLSEGLREITDRNTAKGLSGSGEEAKQLEDYAQNYASGEYSNAFQRQQQQEQSLYNRLLGTSQLGETATGQNITGGEAFGAPQASNLIGSGVFGANAGVAGGAAQAGAQIGANAQKNQMIQQIMLSLLSLLNRNPTAGAGTNPTGPTGLLSSIFG